MRQQLLVPLVDRIARLRVGIGRVTLAGLATAGSLIAAAPASAIVGGQIDGNAHPYVGAIDARQTGGRLTPAGVLISPTVYLKAAHVTRRWDNAGLTRARVTFDPVVTASSTWYTGTVHTDPAYDPNNPSDANDLGVVVFDAPIPGITPASLPTAGMLDQLGPQGLSSQTFTVVGYGVTSSRRD
jgi:V8-like Glu-specific endopeptidase